MSTGSDLRVLSIEARYHLPPSQIGEKARLDRILPVAAEEALAAALERLGYGDHGELCIREIRVPLRLRLSSSDAALALAWGDAMAAAVDAAWRSGQSETVIRFASRRQALGDFARGVARGDLRHAWAWRQLGFGEEAGSAAAAPAELARALAADPEALVPVLAEVAAAGLLPALVARFEASWWPQLAALALATVGWNTISFRSMPSLAGNPSAAATAIPAVDGEPSPAPVSPAAVPGPTAAAGSAWRQARLAELFRIFALPAGSPLAQAFAALVLLEVEPGRLAATPAARREDLLRVAAATLTAPDLDPASHPPQARQATAPESPGSAARSRGEAEAPGTPVSLPNPAAAAAAEASDSGIGIVARHQGFTDWGGLLFLIGVADQIGLPNEIAEHPLLGRRPGRWCWHQLALALVPTTPDDPAALAFAGLLPGATPPSREGDAATEEEKAVVFDWAEKLLRAVAARLEIPGAGKMPALPVGSPDRGVLAEDQLSYREHGGLARSSRLALLDLVCRRRAQVVADPGWIEIHFSLDDVKTELRRARLDLDPGFVPFLGMVLRFIYE